MTTIKLLDDIFIQNYNINKNKVYIEDEKTSITYGKFEEKIIKLSKYLINHCFIQKHDRVLISYQNSIEFYLAFFSIIRSGGIAVPVSNMISINRLRHIIENCNPKISFGIPNRLRKIELLEDLGINDFIILENELKLVGEDFYKIYNINFHNINNIYKTINKKDIININRIDADPIMIIYTSGSTGFPKGIVCSHINVLSATESIVKYLNMCYKDRILNILPPFFDYGLYQSILCSFVGASMILRNNIIFMDELISIINNFDITGFPLVPGIAASLLKFINSTKEISISLEAINKMRFISSTGSPFGSYISKIKEIFCNSLIFSMYGLTECKRVSYLPPHMALLKPNSVGIPIPNVEVNIINDEGNEVNDGEIGTLIVKGSNIALSYWNDKVLSSKIFTTGDYGEKVLYTNDKFKRDNEGYLYFIGRDDGIIKCGSFRINIIEVEYLLLSLPEISEASIIVKKAEDNSDIMHAFIVPNMENLTVNHVKKKLTELVEHSSMIPKTINFLDKMPKNETGKISKQELSKYII